MKLLESELYRKDIKKCLDNIDLSMLSGKSLFITGGLGLIGSAIVDILILSGNVETIYVGARNFNKFIERYGELENVKYIEYDALKDLKLDIKFDYVIHGAGLASPELYTSKPVETILSNINGINNLLEYLKNNKTGRLLYISSSEVYGEKKTGDPFKEEIYGKINIDNIRASYAVAKKASEMLCKSYCSEYNIDVVIARPGHIFGPSAKCGDRRVSSDFSFCAASGKDLVLKSPGLQKRSYCYSLDCAVQILTVLLKGEKGESYNIGHDEVITIRQMASILAKSGNVQMLAETPSEEEKIVFNPMDNSALNNDKVKTLGYKDSFSIEESLSHTVSILKETMDNSEI